MPAWKEGYDKGYYDRGVHDARLLASTYPDGSVFGPDTSVPVPMVGPTCGCFEKLPLGECNRCAGDIPTGDKWDNMRPEELLSDGMANSYQEYDWGDEEPNGCNCGTCKRV
jgi:hypothetical protein